MNSELLKEAIGKKVTVYQDGGMGGIVGKVIDVQDNWVKIEEKKNFRIINIDMVSMVSIPKNQ